MGSVRNLDPVAELRLSDSVTPPLFYPLLPSVSILEIGTCGGGTVVQYPKFGGAVEQRTKNEIRTVVLTSNFSGYESRKRLS